MKFITSLAVLFVGMLLAITQPMAAESPVSVPGATTVNAAEAKALFDSGAKFIDVRKSSDFDAGRVPGAESLDLKLAFTAEALAKVVAKDKEVVIYCNGLDCPRSAEGSAMAVGWGHTKVYYFRDGYPAWQLAGYPVE